jgi:hypothetical protein
VTGGDQLHAEQRARVLIDEEPRQSGWRVCGAPELDLIQYPASAVREVRMKRGHGQVDYLIYVDRKIVGVIEAKPEGTSLSGVEWQSAMYADGLSAAQQLQAVVVEGRLPFVFEASGSEPLHRRVRPAPTRPGRLLLRETGDAREGSAGSRRRPDGPDVARESPVAARARHGRVASGADRGDPWHRAVARRAAP